jgi:pimeloyl-ACP methyl ester carboxylesterase
MQFRRLAEAIGADREALAAHTAARSTRTIPLAKIRADTLVMAGDGDQLAARPEFLADAIPRARLQIISGDHLSAVMNPEFTVAIVDFLGEGDDSR